MSTCHNCDESRIEYTSNGASLLYSFPFEYNTRDDVKVATKNLNNTYNPVADSTWGFANDTTVRLNEPFPAGQKFMIYRCTDINPLPAEFFAGNSIKAQDLNDNFFVLQSAIEENRCAISKVDDEFVNTITQAEQENGLWTEFDDQRLASSDAIRARSDTHVTDVVPPTIVYEQPGKGWENTDKCWSSYWNGDADAWVAYVNTGPRGVQGPQGPPGQSIVGPDGPQGPPGLDGNDGADGADGGTFPDAPADGQLYGRKDNDWEVVTGDIEEAPDDGQVYGRRGADTSWVPVTAAGTFTVIAPLKLENNALSIDLLTLSTIN